MTLPENIDDVFIEGVVKIANSRGLNEQLNPYVRYHPTLDKSIVRRVLTASLLLQEQFAKEGE
jgi:hypothetical protein